MPVQPDTLKQYTDEQLQEEFKLISQFWNVYSLNEMLRLCRHPRFEELANLFQTATIPEEIEAYEELKDLIRKETNASDYDLEKLVNWYTSRSKNVAQTETQL